MQRVGPSYLFNLLIIIASKEGIFKFSLNRCPDVNLLRISRNLERIADLSTNFCEDVIFIIEGKIIKHHGINSLNR